MDIKNEIIYLIDDLGEELKDIVMSSVMVHIDRAEYFYKQAEKQKDEQYYTDVVYRTNQAYEGILKFAYLSFTGGDEDGCCSLSTYQLENYFEEIKIFNERVKVAFTLYRKIWRNPSVHDHELFFKREEAFLALVHVLAFIYILINNCVEHHSYMLSQIIEDLNEKWGMELEPKRNLNSKDITVEVILDKLKVFHKFPKDDIIKGDNISQIIGAIKGYLERKISELDVVTHYKGEEVIGYQPDIILSCNDENIFIIEVKNEFTQQKLEFGYKQLKDYIFRAEVKQGILYFYTDKTDAEYEIISECFCDKEIITLKPK